MSDDPFFPLFGYDCHIVESRAAFRKPTEWV